MLVLFRHVCLSTNNIEKISSLSGMDNLKILSLGRNQIKKIENLDGVADTLEELWMSYNVLEKLVSTSLNCRSFWRHIKGTHCPTNF